MRFSCVVALSLIVVGCAWFEEWPPGWSEAAPYLEENEPHLLALADAMQKDGLSEILRAETTEIAFLDPMRFGEAVRAKYRQLFDKTGTLLWRVSIRDNQARFQFELPWEPSLYRRYILVNANVETGNPSCERDLRSRPCGSCSDSIRDGWTMTFFWLDNSLGRPEEPAIREMTNDEVELRRVEAIDACLGEFRSEFAGADETRRITSP